MRSGLVACCVIFLAAAGRAQQPPPGGVVLLRFDAGMLNPDDPGRAVLAVGAQAGWSLEGSNTLLLRYLRQSRSSTAGLYVHDHARQFLLAQWEHGFGSGEVYRRQYSTRLGLGIMSTDAWPTTAVLNGGVILRYPLTPRLALIASAEDNIALLPHRSCVNTSGGLVCGSPPFGGWQHNFGILASLEWWPGTMPFQVGEPPPVPAPERLPAAPLPDEVCSRLLPSAGKLVRVSTITRTSTGMLVPRHSSEVGPLVRCTEGSIVLGPTLGQDSPELTIFEPTVTGAWTRGNQRVVGTLIGTGAGAILGYVIGSAKSYLCDAQPCAKHRGTSTVIGAVSGGLVGFMLGQATPRWIRRYP